MNSPAPLILAIAFPIAWVSMGLFLSRLGGWARLAARYRDHRHEPGSTYHLRSGAVGAVSYRSCLTLRVCENGLGMAVGFPFRIGHPPLFIPWAEFHGAEVAWFLFFPRIDTSVGLPVVASVSLPIWLRDRLPPECWRSEGQPR